MPFTFVCFLVGGLALAGFPPFSGWLSKDDIIGLLDERGGGFLVLGILGYIGAFLTGIYTFRMIFRAFFGDPVPEAVELEQGHLHHAEQPSNPMTGEIEDSDVGFPGPGHFIAEREWPMRIAMSALAVLALIGGAIQIPGVDKGIEKFLEPSFTDSKFVNLHESTGTAWVGLIIGAIVAAVAIAAAYRIWVRAPGTAVTLRERLAPAYTFLWHKWYFDEAIDLLFVRPSLWFGNFAMTVLERIVVGGAITGGTTGVVRGFSAAVRRSESGYLRYYAALMVLAMSGVALYFLISAA
jgi:NADH-quinone oxidoreductase subunit L